MSKTDERSATASADVEMPQQRDEYIPWNRRCRTCGKRLEWGERKYHTGACARAGKTALQKRARMERSWRNR